MKILILTDNLHAHALAAELQASHDGIDVYQTPHGSLPDAPRLNINERVAEIIEQYDLVVSLHCKQKFPADLIDRVRCVNVHPGFNPYNRGWYPQVFSIIDGQKVGVTIHEIDEQLDHGPIIAQGPGKVGACPCDLGFRHRVIGVAAVSDAAYGFGCRVPNQPPEPEVIPACHLLRHHRPARTRHATNDC